MKAQNNSNFVIKPSLPITFHQIFFKFFSISDHSKISPVANTDPDLWLAPLDKSTSLRVLDLYLLYRKTKTQHRSFQEIDRIFKKYILPALGPMPICDVDRTALTRLIDQVAYSPPKYTPVMARAVAAQMSAFFSWAVARVPELQTNPGLLADRPPKPRPRTRVLSGREIALLCEVLGAEPLPWSHAIKLILLTGQRRAEVFEAEWREFDLNERLWTLPASRAKNGREHHVPLSGATLALLMELPGSRSGKLFPARSNSDRGASGFSKALRRINQRVREKTGIHQSSFTLQDLRRTVATGLQRLGVKIEVTESVLNHISGTRDGIVGVYQLYQYEDEKRHALDSWSTFLDALVRRHIGDGNKEDMKSL